MTSAWTDRRGNVIEHHYEKFSNGDGTWMVFDTLHGRIIAVNLTEKEAMAKLAVLGWA